LFCRFKLLSHRIWKGLWIDSSFKVQTPRAISPCRFIGITYAGHKKITIRKKTRKEREYSFPIRTALIHRLKVRMMPFKDAEKHAKVFMEKFMDIVALFLMPLSYVTFKGSCSANRLCGWASTVEL